MGQQGTSSPGQARNPLRQAPDGVALGDNDEAVRREAGYHPSRTSADAAVALLCYSAA